jgi:uracil-DNA glycosylase
MPNRPLINSHIIDRNKRAAYAELTANARSCTACRPGLINAENCPHPSTWAMWLGNVPARILVVGQDPAGLDNIQDASNPEMYAPGVGLKTNQNLMLRLEDAGIAESEVHLTNAILCFKQGAMAANTRAAWARNCRPLLKETAEVVEPDAIVALGKKAWGSVRACFLPKAPSFGDAVGRGPFLDASGRGLFSMGHCGPLGLRNRQAHLQTSDWEQLGAWLRSHDG